MSHALELERVEAEANPLKQKRQIFQSRPLGPAISQGSHFRPCETCGKIHGGECYWATGACFNCGGKGHIAKDCTSAPRYGPAPTTAEGSIQSPAPRGSQSVSRGRGRGRGTASGSQGTVGQSAQGSASARVYTMRQREEAETSDVVADTEIRGAADRAEVCEVISLKPSGIIYTLTVNTSFDVYIAHKCMDM
ncbi:uncharacterized protein LOC131169416 [Hevea brasiliensis]|uniref:uncharacterized protein LOC131169416 n=1 Tax=Hevea brasiliensis TaxID=3981 RepID=UPI0025D40553|nr:uncharacterized protein LOC131169416 [Hevea brasiliensis]